jgi:glycosyltransferase involved in cell wall biosynthesis
VSGSSNPALTVVIPSFRRLERLPALVAEYLDQGADEVVVVLDGPHPGWERVLSPTERVKVVELAQNRGLALARIAGLEASTKDVILAVDDDVEPGPGLVDRHRAFHATRQNHVLQGYMPIAVHEPRGRDDAPTHLYAHDYEVQAGVWRRGDSAVILGSLWGGNVSLSRDLYLRAEALKPSQRLEYNEDLDLGMRLHRLGAVAVFDDGARAAHHHSRGLTGYMRECVARGGAVADLEERWGERPAQLTPMVTIPRGYNPVLARLQRRIAAHDSGGLVQAGVVAVYRVAGIGHAWRLQDAAARLLRRALIMRGYRLARHP